jgi:S1-C subfamily serine protease
MKQRTSDLLTVAVVVGLIVLGSLGVKVNTPPEVRADRVVEVLTVDGRGGGSGVLIDHDTVLTAHHVIEGETEICVVVNVGTEKFNVSSKTFVKLTGVDAALIKLPVSFEAPEIKLADETPDTVVYGQKLWWYGYPARDNIQGHKLYREGYVMGGMLNYQLPPPLFGLVPATEPKDTYAKLILVDAGGQGGDSGSGVFNEDGELVGIVTLKFGCTWIGILSINSFEDLLSAGN